MNVKLDKRRQRQRWIVRMVITTILTLNSSSALAVAIAYYDFENNSLADKSPVGGHDGDGGGSFSATGTFSGDAYDVSAGGHITLANPGVF